MPWSRKWQPTSVFLPGIFHGQRYLEGYHPRGCKESETTEHTYTQGVSRAVENQGMDSDRPLSFSSYWLWPSDFKFSMPLFTYLENIYCENLIGRYIHTAFCTVLAHGKNAINMLSVITAFMGKVSPRETRLD